MRGRPGGVAHGPWSAEITRGRHEPAPRCFFCGMGLPAHALWLFGRNAEARAGKPVPLSSSMPPSGDEVAAAERQAGIRALRRHHSGTLQYHERVTQVKLIVEASTGQIVMPVEPT